MISKDNCKDNCSYCDNEIRLIKKAKIFHMDKLNDYNLVSQAFRHNTKEYSIILCSDCLGFMESYFNKRNKNLVNKLGNYILPYTK